MQAPASKTKRPKKTAAAAPVEFAIEAFADRAAWLRWLERHHAKMPGIWLKLTKGGAKTGALTVAQAVEGALCWGWIDGQGRALDATHWLVKFTPRRPRSVWSKINRERALALIAGGEMEDAGLAEVTRAQADGRWERAYDSPRNAQVPEDLAAALAKHKRAKAFFEQLDGANRYAILWRLQNAKRAETRASRLATFMTMLARGETLHAPRTKKAKKA